MRRVAVGKGTGGQGTTSLAATVVSPYITEPKRQQNQTSCPDSQATCDTIHQKWGEGGRLIVWFYTRG